MLERLVRGERACRTLARAEQQLRRRGVALLGAAQFIPGARKVMVLGAGMLDCPLRRLLVAEVVGAATWTTFQVSLGYFGGKAVESTGTALVVSLGIAIALGAVLEAVERFRRRAGRPAQAPS